MRWDILNYGRLLNNVYLQDAQFQELAFAYQDAVLTAGREVEDGIISFLRFQEQSARLHDSVEAAKRTVQITTDQYREGAVDFTPVFLFESILAQQQDQLAASQGDVVLSLISIYRALGGGWEMRLSRDGNGAHLGDCVGVVPPAMVGSVPTGGNAATPELAPMPAQASGGSDPKAAPGR
jgi:outer membrane protein TolC